MPFAAPGWSSPLVVHSFPGAVATQDETISIDGTTYVTWATNNALDTDVPRPFFVDLLFDNVVVFRWTIADLKRSFYQQVRDWDTLREIVRREPGPHTLKLVVDSTNLIQETDETDNVIERTFTWSPFTTALPVEARTRLPDLVPDGWKGWSGPIVATSYVDDETDGPLSVDVPTYIRYAFRNAGLTSTPSEIWVYLYLDDVLVDRARWPGLLAGTRGTSTAWSGLFEVTPVSAGVHTLRLVVDATDLVDEADEENNSFEREFEWAAGAVPPRPLSVTPPAGGESTVPLPLTLPNLVPGWRFGSDGPIVVSHRQGTLLDDPLTVDRTAYVDFVVQNRSTVPAGRYEVDLFFDGRLLNTFDGFQSLSPGFFQPTSDWAIPSSGASIFAGPHTLKIVIDPSDRVAEADETDNVFEKTFVWSSFEASPAAAITYTDGELRDILAGLRPLLDTQEPVLAPVGDDLTGEVLRIADAGYFLLTGTSFQDQRVTIYLLTHDGYLEWIDDNCRERLASAPSDERESAYARCLSARDKPAFKTRRFGKVAIVVDAEQTPPEVIDSLAHELGHMRQDFLNPEQTPTVETVNIRAVHEAQAQQFQRAFWARLEEFTGLRLLSFPDYPEFRRIISVRMNGWITNRQNDEHDMGFIVQWLAVMADPALADLRSEVLGSTGLSAESSLRLFDYLVAMSKEEASAYVTERLQSLNRYVLQITAIATSRLEADLDPDLEGNEAMRPAGLFAP